jgi:GAF domain-containing protein
MGSVMSWTPDGGGGAKLARAWLEQAERAAGLGFWSWRCNTQALVLSAEVYRTLGIEPRTGRESVELVLRHLWSDDVARARAFLAELLAGGQRSAIELRALRGDGAPRSISVSAQVERAADGAAISVYGTVLDITHRKHADQALIESEQRLRFLHTLNDAISVAAPDQIGSVALRVLGEHLQVTRCAFGVVQADGDTVIMAPDYTVNCVSIVGPLQITSFGEDFVRAFSAGQPMIVHDTREMSSANIARLDAIQVKAFMGHSLIRQGKIRAIMAVHMSSPRRWTDAEVALVKEVVERCWSMIEQRAAESRLRESEALFRIAGQAARIGGFYIDFGQEERIVLSDEACAIIEVSHGQLLTREHWLALITSDHRDSVRSLLERGEPFDVELSIVSGRARSAGCAGSRTSSAMRTACCGACTARCKTSTSATSSRGSCVNRRRWRPSVSSRVASRTTSTTCCRRS